MTVKEFIILLEKTDSKSNIFIRLNYNVPTSAANMAPLELLQVDTIKHYKGSRVELVCRPNVLIDAKVDSLGRYLTLDIPGCKHCADEN